MQLRRVVSHRPSNRGAWEISPSRTLEAVTAALTVRAQELRNMVLPPETPFMSTEGKGRGQKALKELWLKTDLDNDIVDEVGACSILLISCMESVSHACINAA